MTRPTVTYEVLEIIKSEVEATGKMPTAAMIRDEMEWKGTAGVYDTLTRLCRYGALRRVRSDGPVMQRYELTEASR